MIVVAVATCASWLCIAQAGHASPDPDVPAIKSSACEDQWVVRPTFWQTGCGACNTFYSRVRWNSWGGPTARGVGSVKVVRPRGTESCGAAEGRTRARRSRLILSGKRRCDGQLAYTTITVRRRGKTVFRARTFDGC